MNYIYLALAALGLVVALAGALVAVMFSYGLTIRNDRSKYGTGFLALGAVYGSLALSAGVLALVLGANGVSA